MSTFAVQSMCLPGQEIWAPVLCSLPSYCNILELSGGSKGIMNFGASVRALPLIVCFSRRSMILPHIGRRGRGPSLFLWHTWPFPREQRPQSCLCGKHKLQKVGQASTILVLDAFALSDVLFHESPDRMSNRSNLRFALDICFMRCHVCNVCGFLSSTLSNGFLSSVLDGTAMEVLLYCLFCSLGLESAEDVPRSFRCSFYLHFTLLEPPQSIPNANSLSRSLSIICLYLLHTALRI